MALRHTAAEFINHDGVKADSKVQSPFTRAYLIVLRSIKK